jgi:hypothetical protein
MQRYATRHTGKQRENTKMKNTQSVIAGERTRKEYLGLDAHGCFTNDPAAVQPRDCRDIESSPYRDDCGDSGDDGPTTRREWQQEECCYCAEYYPKGWPNHDEDCPSWGRTSSNLRKAHTPGPWRMGNGHAVKLGSGFSDTEGYTVSAGNTDDDTDRWIADVNCINGENEANARLIAAAPELFEVVLALVGASPKYGCGGVATLSTVEVVAMARAAIAKVEGRAE